MDPAHFWWCNFWVPMSYSLPLNLKVPTDVYFDIPLKKSAPLLLFQPQERFEKFLPRFFNIKKMAKIIFFNLESTLIIILEIFYFLWEVFLINFLSKMKSQMAWKGFGVISKWSFYSLFGSPLILCAICAVLVAQEICATGFTSFLHFKSANTLSKCERKATLPKLMCLFWAT